MSSSEEDSKYEPSLRSSITSDDTASSSDNDYFSTSEEEEGGEGRAWRSQRVVRGFFKRIYKGIFKIKS